MLFEPPLIWLTASARMTLDRRTLTTLSKITSGIPSRIGPNGVLLGRVSDGLK